MSETGSSVQASAKGVDTASWAVAPRHAVGWPIAGEGGLFPVARLFCVGRNYREHAHEMGGDPDREPPFFFMKQPTAVLSSEAVMVFPPRTASLHHEVELVVAIGRGGAAITVENAEEHVFGYAVGLDMTRRDLQEEAKERRRPWDVSKSFDGAAPLGAILRRREPPPANAAILLNVNGEVRQAGCIGDMIWSVAEIIAELSLYQALQPGDLIFTGTPAGVGAVTHGDRLSARVDGLPPLNVTIG